VYADATYPTCVDTDATGSPTTPTWRCRCFRSVHHPDHADDFQPDPVFAQSALLDAGGRAVPNPAHDPGAELQTGNLPFNQTNCVDTVEDVSIFAWGLAWACFNAFLDNTEVFFAVMDALGLDARTRSQASPSARPHRKGLWRLPWVDGPIDPYSPCCHAAAPGLGGQPEGASAPATTTLGGVGRVDRRAR
jgi:hypothetical protein